MAYPPTRPKHPVPPNMPQAPDHLLEASPLQPFFRSPRASRGQGRERGIVSFWRRSRSTAGPIQLFWGKNARSGSLSNGGFGAGFGGMVGIHMFIALMIGTSWRSKVKVCVKRIDPRRLLLGKIWPNYRYCYSQ